MYIETSALDRAERGECHGHWNHKEETTRQGNGEDIRRVSQPLTQTQAPVQYAQSDDIGEGQSSSKTFFPADGSHPEQACGPLGLARVKNYDRRFTFYPGFSVERSLALEFRAEGISQLSTEIESARKELHSADMGKSPQQPLSDSVEKLPILMARLADSIAQYGRVTTRTTESLIIAADMKEQDAALVYGKIVDNTRPPDESSLDQLRLWLDQRSSGQADTYRRREWHDFRILSSQQGPIERVVKVLAPLTKIGRVVLVSSYVPA